MALRYRIKMFLRQYLEVPVRRAIGKILWKLRITCYCCHTPIGNKSYRLRKPEGSRFTGKLCEPCDFGLRTPQPFISVCKGCGEEMPLNPSTHLCKRCGSPPESFEEMLGTHKDGCRLCGNGKLMKDRDICHDCWLTR